MMIADAEEVYREDIKRLPDNGWSLFGLAETLGALKKDPEEMAATNAKSKKTWAKADVKINSSCLCQPGA